MKRSRILILVLAVIIVMTAISCDLISSTVESMFDGGFVLPPEIASNTIDFEITSVGTGMRGYDNFPSITLYVSPRIKDTDTGQTVAMFADRQYATLRPIDIKGFTWYGNAEDIVEQWANQFVEVANRRPGETIKPASTFSLIPW